MKIHDLKPPPGSKKAPSRVGRGIGGKGGKTAGRGTKGQGARNTVAAGFEGGQMPLHSACPKLKGFNNPFRVEYQGVNLDTLEASTGSTRSPRRRSTAKGLVHKGGLVKVLGRGELTRAVHGQGPRLLEVGRGGHHRRRRYASRSCRCRAATAARRPRATTHQPLSDRRPSRPEPTDQEHRCSPACRTCSGSRTSGTRSCSRCS